MRYVREEDACNIDNLHKVGNIHRSGSVRGMQSRYPNDWLPGGQVRVGSYVYNVGHHQLELLRRHGLVRGEK